MFPLFIASFSFSTFLPFITSLSHLPAAFTCLSLLSNTAIRSLIFIFFFNIYSLLHLALSLLPFPFYLSCFHYLFFLPFHSFLPAFYPYVTLTPYPSSHPYLFLYIFPLLISPFFTFISLSTFPPSIACLSYLSFKFTCLSFIPNTQRLLHSLILIFFFNIPSPSLPLLSPFFPFPPFPTHLPHLSSPTLTPSGTLTLKLSDVTDS